MELKKLKKGDIIKNVQLGYQLSQARVIENFPSKNKIYIKYNCGFWGLLGFKILKDYDDSSFELAHI